MFNFLKRKVKTPTEADFDIVADVMIHDMRFSKAEVVSLFMDWTQFPDVMNRRSLRGLILRRHPGFKERFRHEEPHMQTNYASIYAGKLIEALQKLKLIQTARKAGAADYKISKRGEQVRQFYVLKKGLGDSIYDRMDRFQKA